MVPAKIDDLFKERSIHHGGGRIVGVGDDQQLGTWPGLLCGRQQVFKEVSVRSNGNASQVPPGNDHRVWVYGIGGIGRKNHVPGADDRQDQMGKTFLGTDGDNGLFFRI